MKKYNKIVKIMKALAHPHRMELYLKIASQPNELVETEKSCFLAGICEGLKIGAPTISHHLKELSNAGLIVTEREGKFLKARVVPNALKELQDVLFKTNSKDK
jgi:DNA-binding transcriptional ArsR family regulator